MPKRDILGLLMNRHTPIPDIWTTFVPAKMVHISEKSITEKNLLRKTFSKKPYNRSPYKLNWVYLSCPYCIIVSGG